MSCAAKGAKSFKHFPQVYGREYTKDCDFSSLFREGNTSRVSQIKRKCEGKMVDYVSKVKPWNPFANGRKGKRSCFGIVDYLISKQVTPLQQNGKVAN